MANLATQAVSRHLAGRRYRAAASVLAILICGLVSARADLA
jgi:hypothetical protein